MVGEDLLLPLTSADALPERIREQDVVAVPEEGVPREEGAATLEVRGWRPVAKWAATSDAELGLEGAAARPATAAIAMISTMASAAFCRTFSIERLFQRPRAGGGGAASDFPLC